MLKLSSRAGKEKMATPTRLFNSCSLLMAAIFAYSASVQLNDPDWYFWFPLYTCACVVNLVNKAISTKRTNNIILQVARPTQWLGMCLFLKVVIEDLVSGIAGFWSLDLSERLVREKTGSGLVVASMILHLKASSGPQHNTLPRKNHLLPRYVEYGMAVLVTFSFGLPFVFFIIRKGEMEFDHVME